VALTFLTQHLIEGLGGPLPREVLDMYPNVLLIKHDGEVNAQDNREIRKAVEAMEMKQLIVASVTTDVRCCLLTSSSSSS
jgi:hypothetical protein